MDNKSNKISFCHTKRIQTAFSNKPIPLNTNNIQITRTEGRSKYPLLNKPLQLSKNNIKIFSKTEDITYKLDQEINFKIKCCNAVWARATEETTWKRG